jgi:hypothetical protein
MMPMTPDISSLPTLDELKKELRIPEVNTGRVFDYRGIVSDDYEGLHAVGDQNGYIRLQSGVEMPSFMYRGQPEEYLPCLPSLGRLRAVESQLLAVCRNIAFEDAISDHPFVRITENKDFLGNPLYVDKQGLAQHYGLATDMIDLTSNFDVASFFAVCRLDEQEKCYLPVKDTGKPGVIYRIIPCILSASAWAEEREDPFSFVGWQPLPRPEQQRACGVKLRNGEDFLRLPSVQKVYFRHNDTVAERIWDAFDQGAALFPDDAAAELATQARRLGSFTRAQVVRAWAKLESWLGRAIAGHERTHAEKGVALAIVDKPVLCWDGLAIEHDEACLKGQLNEVLNRVRYRKCAYPK